MRALVTSNSFWDVSIRKSLHASDPCFDAREFVRLNGFKIDVQPKAADQSYRGLRGGRVPGIHWFAFCAW